jgi:3-oxoacyl-[acyl-carrier-protein] synthase II
VGEGSNFFVISSERSGKSMARVDGLEILNRCEKPEELTGYMLSFLASKGVAAGEIDLFVSGRNGDQRYAHLYSQLEKLFPTDKVMGYKHLVGEYHTASAFGMWLSARLIRENGFPDSERLHPKETGSDTVTGLAGTLPIRRALLFNQNKGRDFTWILISHPDT